MGNRRIKAAISITEREIKREEDRGRLKSRAGNRKDGITLAVRNVLSPSSTEKNFDAPNKINAWELPVKKLLSS